MYVKAAQTLAAFLLQLATQFECGSKWQKYINTLSVQIITEADTVRNKYYCQQQNSVIMSKNINA